MLPVPVLANVTVWPLTAFPCASFKVTVTVEVVLLSVVTLAGEAAIEEVVAEAAPGIKATVLVIAPKPAGVVIETVFVSALVDLIVPVAAPEASVTATG